MMLHIMYNQPGMIACSKIIKLQNTMLANQTCEKRLMCNDNK